jgi:cytochrome c oxidase subunit 2
MLIRVVAQTPEDFKRWVAEQQKPAVMDPKIADDRRVFESLACVNCHMVRGTTAQGKFGPDLTHLMSRQTIAANVRTTSRQDLRAWIDNPQDIKPGVFMPSMKLTDTELDQVVNYMQSLK